MPTMTFTAIDATTGAPIPKCEVTSQYNTTPCPWDAFITGCTSGDGQNIQGYTDENGNYTWNIPWTCAGSFTNTTFSANGYATQTIGNNSFAAFPNDMQIKAQLQPFSITNPSLPPPGQGPFDWSTTSGNLWYWWNQSSSSWWNDIQSGGWELVAVLVAVGVVIIGIAAILWRV
jgi:hypothetical protein